MRVLILTFGTHGDVLPYVALASGLLAAGHEAAVCTAEGFQELVTEAGVPYEYMSNDMLEIVQSAMPGMAGPAEAVQLARRMAAAMRSSLVDQWEAAQRFRPDVLVYHPKVLGGLHIAERLGVPAVLSLPLPFFTPTRAFPIPFVGRWPFGGTFNRASYQFNRFTAVAYGGMINSFRRKVLGLRRMSRLTDYLHHSDGRPVPILYAYSPAVVPVPPDYPDHAHVTGYWVLDGQRSLQPPAELVDFVDAGPPPIYAGFGSMGFGRNAIERGRAVVQAVTNAGLRAVVATGWGGLRVESSSERIYVVDQVDHEWLFPRMAAVVHHGGAGTTAAGLRAGRPTLICPVAGDQGFWGERVRDLGLGPAPLPARRLTVAALTPRLLELTSTHEYRERTTALARQLAREDGVSTAIRVIETLEAATGRGA